MPPFRDGRIQFDPSMHVMSEDGRSFVLKTAIENDKQAADEARLRKEEKPWYKKLFADDTWLDVVQEQANIQYLEQVEAEAPKKEMDGGVQFIHPIRTLQDHLLFTFLPNDRVHGTTTLATLRGNLNGIPVDLNFGSMVGTANREPLTREEVQLLFDKLNPILSAGRDAREFAEKRRVQRAQKSRMLGPSGESTVTNRLVGTDGARLGSGKGDNHKLLPEHDDQPHKNK